MAQGAVDKNWLQIANVGQSCALQNTVDTGIECLVETTNHSPTVDMIGWVITAKERLPV